MPLLKKLVMPALEGLPRNISIPRLGIKIEAGPFDEARAIADQYMRDQGLPYEPIQKYAKVNVDRAKKIAAAFEAMRDDPSHPGVRKAYKALADETLAQWNAIKKYGNLKTDYIKDGIDPYEASPRLAIEDITKNNHMWVFPTDTGYGQTGITPEMIEKNPMLAMTDETIGG